MPSTSPLSSQIVPSDCLKREMVWYAVPLITTTTIIIWILRGSEDVFSGGSDDVRPSHGRTHSPSCLLIHTASCQSIAGKNSNPAKTSTESLRCASRKLSLKVHCRFQILLFTVIFKQICICLNFYVDSLFNVSTILTLIKNCRGHIVGTESPFICLDSHGHFGLEALLCHSSCIYDQRCRFKVKPMLAGQV